METESVANAGKIIDTSPSGSNDSKNNSSVRIQRNQAEKKRRDRLNEQIATLATLVPTAVTATKPLDKVSILRLAASWMRLNYSCLNPKNFKSAIKNYLNLHQSLVSNLDILEKSINGFVVATTFSGIILMCSKYSEEYIGYQNIDLLGQDISNFIHNKEKDLFQKKIRNIISKYKKNSSKLRNSVRVHMQQRPLARSNDVRYRKMSFSLTIHAGGSITKESINPKNVKFGQRKDFGEYAVILIFIEPIQTEPNIDVQFLEQKDCYLTVHGTQGEIIFADHRISFMTGYMPSDVLGNSAYQYIHPSDVPIALFAQKAMFASNDGTGIITYRLRIRDTSYIYLQSKGQIRFKDSSKEVRQFICCNLLLNEKEGQEELKKFQDRFAPQLVASKLKSKASKFLSTPENRSSASSDLNEKSANDLKNPKGMNGKVVDMEVEKLLTNNFKRQCSKNKFDSDKKYLKSLLNKEFLKIKPVELYDSITLTGSSGRFHNNVYQSSSVEECMEDLMMPHNPSLSSCSSNNYVVPSDLNCLTSLGRSNSLDTNCYRNSVLFQNSDLQASSFGENNHSELDLGKFSSTGFQAERTEEQLKKIMRDFSPLDVELNTNLLLQPQRTFQNRPNSSFSTEIGGEHEHKNYDDRSFISNPIFVSNGIHHENTQQNSLPMYGLSHNFNSGNNKDSSLRDYFKASVENNVDFSFLDQSLDDCSLLTDMSDLCPESSSLLKSPPESSYEVCESVLGTSLPSVTHTQNSDSFNTSHRVNSVESFCISEKEIGSQSLFMKHSINRAIINPNELDNHINVSELSNSFADVITTEVNGKHQHALKYIDTENCDIRQDLDVRMINIDELSRKIKSSNYYQASPHPFDFQRNDSKISIDSKRQLDINFKTLPLNSNAQINLFAQIIPSPCNNQAHSRENIESQYCQGISDEYFIAPDFSSNLSQR